MAATHADTEAEKGRLLEEQEDEGSSTELSGGRTAVASPINRLASIDIEGLNDVDVEKEGASTQEKPQKSGAKLIAWITINTLATIGIVRPPSGGASIFNMLRDCERKTCTDSLRCYRSSPTKPSSPTLPFKDVRSPLHPSISS